MKSVGLAIVFSLCFLMGASALAEDGASEPFIDDVINDTSEGDVGPAPEDVPVDDVDSDTYNQACCDVLSTDDDDEEPIDEVVPEDDDTDDEGCAASTGQQGPAGAMLVMMGVALCFGIRRRLAKGLRG